MRMNFIVVSEYLTKEIFFIDSWLDQIDQERRLQETLFF